MSRHTQIARTPGQAIPVGAMPLRGYQRRPYRLSHTNQKLETGL